MNDRDVDGSKPVRLRGSTEANDEVRIGWVLAAVAAADPALSAEVVRAALERVAPGPA